MLFDGRQEEGIQRHLARQEQLDSLAEQSLRVINRDADLLQIDEQISEYADLYSEDESEREYLIDRITEGIFG
jgi:hypothetical protein